jgi:UDP-N-acetylmuramyl pentapeptide phosphotransferase/UDP-N-acetylglucosamine-1-phosphate transferase
MNLAIGLVLGLGAGAATYRLLLPTLGAPLLARTNHRGAPVATAAGLVVVLAVIVVEGALGLVEAGGFDPVGAAGPRRLVILATVGFGLLGLIDDLLGAGESGGFSGHLGALRRGRLTSGGVKLFGGAALALAVMAAVQPGSVGRILADGALVALAANLGNLFDRAPGRCLKVSTIAFAALVAASAADPALVGVALVVGAGLALLPGDLGERVMLGDAGANVLGAVLGIGVVLVTAPAGRNVVLVVLVALNLASEKVSFSAVIDRVGPLRWTDRLGRRP